MITVENEEREQLRSAIRKVLEREAPLARSIADSESGDGYDRGLWRRLGTELGVTGLCIPERFGGAGAQAQDEAILAEELGSALACTPYLATVSLAVNLLLGGSDDATAAEYLPAIAAGERTAAVVYRGSDGQVGPEWVPVGATEVAAGWRLDGRARFVLDGHSADLLLVLAETDEGIQLFAVDPTVAGVTRQRMPTLDQLRSMSWVEFTGAPGRPIGSGPAWPALQRALDLATVAIAAEQTACAELVLRQTVEYTALRVQFARTIGSFQAVKHRCAETLVSNDRARSALSHAVWAADTDTERLPAAAAMAALVCGRAFLHAAQENVQLHGGIGFTWEHPAHRYVRRATADLSLLADHRYYEDQLLRGIGIDEPRLSPVRTAYPE
jgi:alkylation response protein AidB-like acyl-CoA dehydrogenase